MKNSMVVFSLLVFGIFFSTTLVWAEVTTQEISLNCSIGYTVWSNELDRVAMFNKQEINELSSHSFFWLQTDGGVWQEQLAPVGAGAAISSLCWSEDRKEYIF